MVSPAVTEVAPHEIRQRMLKHLPFLLLACRFFLVAPHEIRQRMLKLSHQGDGFACRYGGCTTRDSSENAETTAVCSSEARAMIGCTTRDSSENAETPADGRLTIRFLSCTTRDSSENTETPAWGVGEKVADDVASHEIRQRILKRPASGRN